jgi:hypothetical protein
MAVIPDRVCKMRTVFEKGVADLNFEGQAGFICVGKNECNEPTACVAVTALHNIAEIKDDPSAVFVRSTALPYNCNVGQPFPEAGIKLSTLTPFELSASPEMSIRWKHNVGIAWSSKVITTAYADVEAQQIVGNCFEIVRDDFECRVGQKIGIVIYSDTGATPKTAGNPNVSQGELNRIYGPPKTTHIYTGVITLTSTHHIEYDINAFEGCSGAVVFLLGIETQPTNSGVTLNDVGKAIAVHAGAHPRKVKNFGFKFTAKLPP